MKLITKMLKAKLVKNHNLAYIAHSNDECFDPKPVIKLFTPWTSCTWLITELDPETKILFGLCDLGMGMPELGYVALSDIESVVGPAGLKIERDIHFKASKTLSAYFNEAYEKGCIVV